MRFESQHNSHCGYLTLFFCMTISMPWSRQGGSPQNSWNSIQIQQLPFDERFMDIGVFPQKILTHQHKKLCHLPGNLRQKVLQILLWRGKDGGSWSISKLHVMKTEKGACVELHRLFALGGGKYHFEPSSELARDTKFTVQWCLSCEIKPALLHITRYHRGSLIFYWMLLGFQYRTVNFIGKDF